MMYRLLIHLMVFGLTIVLFSSCLPDTKTVYDGDLQIEFRPVEDSHPASTGEPYEANIQLIGPHQEDPITVEFEVDTENSSGILEEHFELDSATTTIPANSSFGKIEIFPIQENIDDEVVIYITLIGDESGEVRPAVNYATLELTITP